MKTPLALLLLAAGAFGQMRVVDMRDKSPLVNFRIVFTTGAAADPEDKPGLAHLTASMLSGGGTRDLTYQQVLDALFPMAASVSSQVDKQMTTFYGTTHVENLEAYYKLFRAMLLEPGWREDDFKRIRENTINFLRVTLRGNNDEELGKEVLYNELYAKHPYGRHNAGTVAGLEKITLDDVKEFYRKHYTQAHLIVGMAGGYTPQFLERVKKDFRQLAPKGFGTKPLPGVAPIKNTRLTIVDKDTRSVAYSFGFPIIVKRGHPDYPALLLATSWLGQHRLSSGRLYQRMREARGLNYGDYAYIEYFPRGMFQFEPSPNLARDQQIFQIWIRPVERANARFALRLALFELNRFVRDGLSEQDFQNTRTFLSKYVNLLMKSKSAELGYAIDSMVYGIPDYRTYLRNALAKLTRAEVNRVIRRYLRTDRLHIVAVAKDAEALKKELLDPSPSPMTYNSPKPDDLLAEDKVVASWKLGLRPEDIKIVPVGTVFE